MSRLRDWRALLTAAVLLLACGLRTVQYLGRTSLWFDELALVLSVQRRSLVDLVSRPLADDQVAPVGFLAAVKGASVLLGVNELALRLVPWLCALAAVFLLWRVAGRALQGLPLVGVLLLFAASPALVWYGGNVKPYSGDVAMALLLALVGLRFLEAPEDGSRALVGAIAGPMAMLFSYPAVPTAAVIGFILLLHGLSRRPRPRVAPLLWLGAAWTAGAALAAGLSLRQLDPAGRAYMNRFWALGFPPASFTSVPALLWAPHRIFAAWEFLQFFLAGPRFKAFVAVCAAFALAGLLARLARQPWPTALILAPIAAAVAAAYARLLPFEDRLGLHAAWPLLIFTMVGVQWVRTRLPARARWVMTALGVLIAGLPVTLVLAGGRPPYHAQETRLVLGTLAERWRPGDGVYAYYGARHAMEFYGRQLGFREWTAGSCHREDPRAYFREIDALRGRPRVWFFYTHAARGYREPTVIRSYLETIGRERDHIPDPLGLTAQLESAAYLYDLSDPARLSAATAEDHRFPELWTGEPRTLCDGTLQPGRVLE